METDRLDHSEINRIFWGRLQLKWAHSYLKMKKNSATQHLIHSIKYEGNRELARALGKDFALYLSSFQAFEIPNFIVPVPLHPKKKKKRGFNQSACIVEGMLQAWPNSKISHALKRQSNASSQTRKNRIERWKNVKDNFSLKAAHELEHSQILLVDDVLTTGATLEACGSELLKIEGIELSIATIAYAP